MPTTVEPVTTDGATVAVYRKHSDAEDAVRRLRQGGIPMQSVSIVGRDWQLREDVQGYYHPGDAAAQGAATGAWFGGLWGLLLGFGFFLFPVAGPLFVLGPLAGLIAGGIAGAGVGALIAGLVALGVPRDQALKYQSQLQAGEFLLIVHGTAADIDRAREILQATPQTALQTHYVAGSA